MANEPITKPVLMQSRKSKRDESINLEAHRENPPKRDSYGKAVAPGAKTGKR